ncbi:MAG TPA: DUF4337 family protein [Gemmatales bacterium]|nr:DUF4337 family protein [Gemmatales bacterium]
MHNPAEIVEHASEKPAGHGGGMHRWIGLTTAMLSILIAVCSSQANAVRTDFIARMVEEDGTTVRFQTVSTKYVVLQAQLQHIHAMMPDPPLYLAAETQLRALESSKMNEETTKIVQALRLSTKKLLEAVMPSGDDVQHFAKLIRNYRTELDAARKWAESYTPVIEVLAETTSWMEKAQLVSELAVILASLALMTGNIKWLSRSMWITSIALGITSIVILIVALVLTQGRLHRSEARLEEAREAYLELIKGNDNAARDEALLKGIEADLEKLKINP